MEFFTALGLEPALELDPAELERRYYAASRELHPDRYARASAAQQAEALAKSSLLTRAYRTLRDPHARAEYLLAQKGIVSKELPPGFLEEAFEWNERMEEGGEAERENLRGMLNEIDAALHSLYARWDACRDDATLGEIRRKLNQRRYIENLVHGHI